MWWTNAEHMILFFLTEYILKDLYLEFCEELDESTDSSEDGEAQMTE